MPSLCKHSNADAFFTTGRCLSERRYIPLTGAELTTKNGCAVEGASLGGLLGGVIDAYFQSISRRTALKVRKYYPPPLSEGLKGA